jgi:hypothetical protein
MSADEETSNQSRDGASSSAPGLTGNGNHNVAGRLIYVSCGPDGRRAVHLLLPAPAQLRDTTTRAYQATSAAVTTTARQARHQAVTVVDHSKPYSQHIATALGSAIVVLLLITVGRGRARSSAG